MSPARAGLGLDGKARARAFAALRRLTRAGSSLLQEVDCPHAVANRLFTTQSMATILTA